MRSVILPLVPARSNATCEPEVDADSGRRVSSIIDPSVPTVRAGSTSPALHIQANVHSPRRSMKPEQRTTLLDGLGGERAVKLSRRDAAAIRERPRRVPIPDARLILELELVLVLPRADQNRFIDCPVRFQTNRLKNTIAHRFAGIGA